MYLTTAQLLKSPTKIITYRNPLKLEVFTAPNSSLKTLSSVAFALFFFCDFWNWFQCNFRQSQVLHISSCGEIFNSIGAFKSVYFKSPNFVCKTDVRMNDLQFAAFYMQFKQEQQAL